MGMFTTAVAPDGTEWQFKTGWDDCETFKVGDKVPTRKVKGDHPRRILPGHLHIRDDVYDACCSAKPAEPDWTGLSWDSQHVPGVRLREERHGPPYDPGWPDDGWVIVKGSLVVAILPRERKGDGEYEREHLIAKYGIPPPDFGLWTDAEWAEEARASKRRLWKTLHENAELYGFATMAERADHTANRYTRAKMQEDGFARKIFPVSPVVAALHGPSLLEQILPARPLTPEEAKAYDDELVRHLAKDGTTVVAVEDFVPVRPLTPEEFKAASDRFHAQLSQRSLEPVLLNQQQADDIRKAWEERP